MHDVPSLAVDSPQRWRQVRRVINENRQELARLAAGLYQETARTGTTDLLCRPDWIADQPLDLADLALRWTSHAPAPAVNATGPESAHVRPRTPAGDLYPSYAEAIAALDRPALFEDRVCYRILGARLAAAPELAFGRCQYFDGVNLGHALGHELAAAWQRNQGEVSLADLPLRALTGDPCELGNRSSLAAITTLTLRRGAGGAASFLLHWRDPAKVNHAGGMFQVMPAGIFQPATDAPAAQPHDFSLWRCLVREFSEEFLGTSEDYQTTAGLLDYQSWPFCQQLASARQAGQLTVSCLGVGVDPVTLATDILTVAVFDTGVFDSLFADLVALNAEGRVVMEEGSAGIPFTADAIARFSDRRERMQPAGAALLQLAWQHRAQLLG